VRGPPAGSSRGRFQSSPVPKDGCNLKLAGRPSPATVSILTRPEGRVQLVDVAYRLDRRSGGFNPHPSRRTGATCDTAPKRGKAVSILTRPEGRVQRPAGMGGARFSSFNPHPSRRTGATHSRDAAVACGLRFNPHPSRRTGATPPVRASKSQRCLFQSSPVPKDGCNQVVAHRLPGNTRFQSSPVPKDGCNGTPRAARGASLRVSILTRPEGRVQPQPKANSPACHVSILTRPEGRVQRRGADA
jgi:hypothetical protein